MRDFCVGSNYTHAFYNAYIFLSFVLSSPIIILSDDIISLIIYWKPTGNVNVIMYIYVYISQTLMTFLILILFSFSLFNHKLLYIYIYSFEISNKHNYLLNYSIIPNSKIKFTSLFQEGRHFTTIINLF